MNNSDLEVANIALAMSVFVKDEIRCLSNRVKSGDIDGDGVIENLASISGMQEVIRSMACEALVKAGKIDPSELGN